MRHSYATKREALEKYASGTCLEHLPRWLGREGGHVRLVIIESPYAGNVKRNTRYLRACMRDCLLRGESPYASHGLYTQPGVLDDQDPDERALGIRAGFEWRLVAEASVVYTDLGVSSGMLEGIAHAEKCGIPVERRSLGVRWEERAG